MLHIEGMGVVGSILAHELNARGILFTWHDTEETVCAWKACTGAVLPEYVEEFARWEALASGRFARYTEFAEYWHAPAKAGNRFGPFERSSELSLHVNAQALVRDTRHLFAATRTTGRNPNAELTVRAHGFHSNCRYLWGWSVPVRIAPINTPKTDTLASLRHAIQVRKNRGDFAYAYPMPGTGLWYAGSSMISQQRPNALDVERKAAKWQRIFAEGTEGRYAVEIAGEPSVGWRPVGVVKNLRVQRFGSEIRVYGLGSLGVTRAPSVAQEVIRCL